MHRFRKLNATVLGLLTAAIVGVSGHIVSEERVVECEVVTAHDNVGQGTWDLLVEKGWEGRPGDSMEAIYSPACKA